MRYHTGIIIQNPKTSRIFYLELDRYGGGNDRLDENDLPAVLQRDFSFLCVYGWASDAYSSFYS